MSSSTAVFDAVPAEALDHAVSAGDVSDAVPPVRPYTRCEAVAELFGRHPSLFAQPVVDDEERPLGLLNRFRLLDRLSQRFGRELFSRRPIVECLDGPVLLLDEHTPIEDVAAQLFSGGRNHILDGSIVTRDGRYLGIVTGLTLTRALTDLTLVRARVASEKAVRENAAKSTFISNVSHEIRTPLNGVLGIATLLHDTPLSTEQRVMVDLLRVSGEALMALVDDVLDFSKIEASRFEIDHVEFDLRTLVADTMKILGVRANRKGLPVSSEIDPRVPHVVIGDPVRLRQVLLNLGGNAVKFTEQGGVTVRVRILGTSLEQVRLEIRVKDTGMGIPRDRLELLFKPFYQIDASNSRQFGGTGLGLTISREIVQRMGGDITVESEIGCGSTFTVTATLATPANAGAAASDPMGVSATCASAALCDGGNNVPMRVLLAEDNPVNQVVAAGLLRKLGCSVRIVSDGSAAIAALTEQPFDLVLMDCNMPGIDGYEATRRIRSGAAGAEIQAIPIVALTASATTENHVACTDAGMNGFLTKPFSLSSLERGIAPWRRAAEGEVTPPSRAPAAT